MPSLCECFGRTEDARQDAYKADGPASDGLPSQISIPASAASAAADVHKDAVEQGATREAARQQRAEAADEPRSDDRARGRADVQDTAPKKKEKDSGGHEGCAAVGGAADSGVPTIVVINTGDEKEGERDGELDTEQVQPVIEESTTEQPGAGAAAAQVVEAGDLDGEDAEGNSAVLQDLGQQVIKECGAIGGAETAEGLAELVGSLASGAAESAFSALENLGPVGPLFKCLGMFMHFVGRVRGARAEGERLRQWAATLIPIIRQSVPTPFPADIEKSKQEELTQCTQQVLLVQGLKSNTCIALLSLLSLTAPQRPAIPDLPNGNLAGDRGDRSVASSHR